MALIRSTGYYSIQDGCGEEASGGRSSQRGVDVDRAGKDLKCFGAVAGLAVANLH